MSSRLGAVQVKNPVDPQLESVWFQPLLSNEKLVSKFAFKCNLYRYLKLLGNLDDPRYNTAPDGWSVGLHSLPGVRLVTWTILAVINWRVLPYALLGGCHSRVSDWLHVPYRLSSTGFFTAK
jgi:hypothetical protein